MISDPCFHRGRDAQCTVNTAKIVVREVQCDGGLQVFEFLAEAQTQSRHAPEKRSHAEVATLHMRRTGKESDDQSGPSQSSDIKVFILG